MDLWATGWWWVSLRWGTGGGLLWMRWWTFGFWLHEVSFSGWLILIRILYNTFF
jgi:hypothetical protein